MKNKFFLLCVFAACSLFFSCENEFADVLLRTTADPFYEAPCVDSFTLENTIYVSWSADDASDSFILMRAIDAETPVFYEVYSGTDTSYTDTDLSSGYRYLYRLDKTRGNSYFTGTDYGYGVSSSVRRDSYEDNDTHETATELEYECACSIPCVKFYDGTTILDSDWFYVTVPARKKAYVSLEQTSESISKSEATYFNALILSSNSDEAVSNISPVLVLTNTDTESRKLYFKIYPNTSKVFSSSTAYYSNLQYTITLTEIVND